VNLNLDALESSFDHIAPRGDELMDVFYARLFGGTDLKQKAMLLAHTPVTARPRVGDPRAVPARGTSCPVRSSASALPRRGRGPDRLDGSGSGEAWTPELEGAESAEAAA
jgi:hypothetical protein